MSFKSISSYSEFCNATRHKNRYIHCNGVTSFLKAVLETSKERERIIDKDIFFWRGQLGNDWQPIFHEGEEVDSQPSPYKPERMKPIPNSATEGRANPKGIPYLYVATNRETAMSEVRPWQGSSISVGQFKVNRLLRLIDCSVNYGKSWIDFHGETAEERRKLTVWSDIDNAFSKPVIPSDQSSEYVPTQVIAEFFKSHCYDGIVYKRSLSSTGFNVVLFDLGVADLINCFLYEVQEIDFKFKETANPYFMKTHYNSAD